MRDPAVRVVVAAIDADADDEATLSVSRAHLALGQEVVHLGPGLDPAGVAAVAVAEDASVVVLVAAAPPRCAEVLRALEGLDAQDVEVRRG